MGNPVLTCSESRQSISEAPECSAYCSAYRWSFHLPVPSGHGVLSFRPAQAGYREATALVSSHNSLKASHTLASKEGRTVSILCTPWLSKKDVTGPRRQLSVGTDRGSILALQLNSRLLPKAPGCGERKGHEQTPPRPSCFWAKGL